MSLNRWSQRSRVYSLAHEYSSTKVFHQHVHAHIGASTFGTWGLAPHYQNFGVSFRRVASVQARLMQDTSIKLYLRVGGPARSTSPVVFVRIWGCSSFLWIDHSQPGWSFFHNNTSF